MPSSGRSEGTKRCPKCKTYKDRADFHNNADRKDGKNCWCKACAKVYDKMRTRLRTDKHRKTRREYAKTLKHQYSTLKHHARKVGADTDMSIEEYAEFRSRPCYYCGGPLNPTGHAADKKNPKGLYLKANMAPCCGFCNKVKLDHLTFEEMVLYVGPALREVRIQREKKNEE